MNIPKTATINNEAYINAKELIAYLNDHNKKIVKDCNSPIVKASYSLAYIHIEDCINLIATGESCYSYEVIKNDDIGGLGNDNQ